MTPNDPAAGTGPSGRIRTFLVRRSKIVCVGILIAVVAPAVLVALQITPATSTRPAATDFEMWDSQTLASFSLSDHRGKVVLLDFMETTCDACRASMTDLLAIHDGYANASFVLLSVAMGPWDTPGAVEAFRKAYSANWTFGLPVDPEQVGTDYIVSGYPTYALIDAGGLITYRAVGLVPLERLASQISNALGA